MDLDTYLDHGAEEVKQAVVQFAARRSYRLRKPWYIEGLRIESPSEASGDDGDGRIDIELKRKRGKTRLRITVGRGSESTRLAYELQSYLQDDRAYHAQCPPMCPKCGRPIANLHARYCGRCGRKLVTGSVEAPPQVAAPARAAPPPVPSSPATLPRAVPSRAPIVVERETTPEPAAAKPEAELETPVVEASGTASETPADSPTVEESEGREPDLAEPETDAPEPPEAAAAEAEAESEPDFHEENRPRRALAED
jgi:ribosomal protein S27AE